MFFFLRPGEAFQGFSAFCAPVGAFRVFVLFFFFWLWGFGVFRFFRGHGV